MNAHLGQHGKWLPHSRFPISFPALGAASLLLLGMFILGSIFSSQVAAKEFGHGYRPAPMPAVFAPIGTYATGLGDASAEVAAYERHRLYVTNGADNSFDIVDIGDPTHPQQIERISLKAYGAGPNSIAVSGKIVAVAVAADPKTDPGKVVFFDLNGIYLNQVTVGALPDMLTFTPDGRHLLVANEGEPENGVDPEGTVSIIHVPRFPWLLSRMSSAKLQKRVRTAGFRAFGEGYLEARGVRIIDASVKPYQDLEPEYITVSDDSRHAWVSLQENNAIALLDVQRARFRWVRGLGLKDHGISANGLDASDKDGLINIQSWPVFGMYQPDAVAAFRSKGRTYIVSANEGDARDGEEARIEDLDLSPVLFPDAVDLQEEKNLGRLTVTNKNGKIDGDGNFEELWAFGARSFSIWTAAGELVYDSGDDFEQIVAAVNPTFFNSDNDKNTFDSRSDNKGPEPEGVAVGRIDGRTYAFIGLERVGGVMIYDITDPYDPQFVQYTNNRDFTLDPPAPDSGPEVLVFIPRHQSPNRRALLLVANEVSGTVTIYQAGSQNDAVTLSLLHNNDGESSLLPFVNDVNGTQLPIGGIAAFKTLTDRQIREARAAGHSVVNVYAGDAFLASATLACSQPPNPPDTPVYDAVAQRKIPYDAHIFGNHEFDFGPDFLERFIRSFEVNGVLNQPFLSANLDFSAEPGFSDLIRDDGLLAGLSTDGQVVARSAIITDKVTGQRFGIVGATTPALPTISSPRDVLVTSDDLDSTAAVVQAEVDRLMAAPYHIRRIIFVSHLQDIDTDVELAALLRGVDLLVGGGGDELLVNPDVPLEEQLLPGESAPIGRDYPIQTLDAEGNTVYIVTTAGNYKYLGRIVAVFDGKGQISEIVNHQTFPRRVIPKSDAAAQLGITDAVEPDPAIVENVIEPVEACLEELQNPIIGTEVPLDVSRAGSRGRETNTGNLVADAYLYTYDQFSALNGLPARDGTVIAVQNGGGIRQNAGDVLPVGGAVPGTITRDNTLNVLAFLTNSVTVVQDVTPEDLKQILERAASDIGGGQFLQIGGFRVVYDLSRTAQVIATDGTVTTPGERVVSAELLDGTEMIAEGLVVSGAPNVAIVTNSFTAAGGDNYPWLAENPNKLQFPATYEQAWVEYLLSFPVLYFGLPTIPEGDPRYQPGGEGRITVVNAP
jgi:2',3'-cyclic-nucleotide 2'-phosphodiesterase / 3'-nucleotidase / 5'-nucleotidase